MKLSEEQQVTSEFVVVWVVHDLSQVIRLFNFEDAAAQKKCRAAQNTQAWLPNTQKENFLSAPGIANTEPMSAPPEFPCCSHDQDDYVVGVAGEMR